jgi:hypothetical protein
MPYMFVYAVNVADNNNGLFFIIFTCFQALWKQRNLESTRRFRPTDGALMVAAVTWKSTPNFQAIEISRVQLFITLDAL